MTGRATAFKVAAKTARRNRKRTLLLVVLVAVPVMVAVVVSGYIRANTVSAEESAVSLLGHADVRLEFIADDQAVVPWATDLVKSTDPSATVLGYRSILRGWLKGHDGRLVDIDLNNPMAAGSLTLFSGRAPVKADEVVLTEYLADAFGVAIGDEIALILTPGDQEIRFELVGLVSHPVIWRRTDVVVVPQVIDELIERGARLMREEPAEGELYSFTVESNLMRILLVETADEMAVVEAIYEAWETDRYQFYPRGTDLPRPPEFDFVQDEMYVALEPHERVELLEIRRTQGVDAAGVRAREMLDGRPVWGVHFPQMNATSHSQILQWHHANPLEAAPVVGGAVAAVLLVEVAFIAGAAFATGARRRLREIGLIGSNGASDKHVKTIVMGEGLVVGLLGGLGGAALALALIVLFRPTLQRFVERRIAEFPLQVADLIAPVVLAVVACAVAAWLPSRTAASVPTLAALQGRMPVSRPKRWVPPVGVLTAGIGTLLFSVGTAAGSGRRAATVTVLGAAMMIGGVAMLAGPLVSWVSRRAGRFPVTPRLVLRDSGRQRTRASAAVAATMVIMVMPVAVMASEASRLAGEKLYGLPPSSAQVIVFGKNDPSSSEILPFELDQAGELRGALAEIERLVPNSRSADFPAFDVDVKYPAEWRREKQGIPPGAGRGERYVDPTRMAIATPELLELLGDDRLQQVLERDGMVLVGIAERMTEIGVGGEAVAIAEVPVAVHLGRFPRLLVTEAGARVFGETPVKLLALVKAEDRFLNMGPSPFEPLNLPETRLGVFFEESGGINSMSYTLAFMLLVTLLIVLIVVATITALSASEADGDIQAMVAVGAENSIRRKYLGMQGYLHTLLGTLLGIPLALLLVKATISASGGDTIVGNFDVLNSGQLHVPWVGVVLLFIAVPLVIGLLTAAFVRSAPLTPPRRAF